jgi:hypothetical protein
MTENPQYVSRTESAIIIIKFSHDKHTWVKVNKLIDSPFLLIIWNVSFRWRISIGFRELHADSYVGKGELVLFPIVNRLWSYTWNISDEEYHNLLNQMDAVLSSLHASHWKDNFKTFEKERMDWRLHFFTFWSIGADQKS